MVAKGGSPVGLEGGLVRTDGVTGRRSGGRRDEKPGPKPHGMNSDGINLVTLIPPHGHRPSADPAAGGIRRDRGGAHTNETLTEWIPTELLRGANFTQRSFYPFAYVFLVPSLLFKKNQHANNFFPNWGCKSIPM